MQAQSIIFKVVVPPRKGMEHFFCCSKDCQLVSFPEKTDSRNTFFTENESGVEFTSRK